MSTKLFALFLTDGILALLLLVLFVYLSRISQGIPGIASWRFFSSKPDYDFCEWDFSGTTEEETDFLYGLLDELGKESYMLVHNQLGANVCRIVVPGFSSADYFRAKAINLLSVRRLNGSV